MRRAALAVVAAESQDGAASLADEVEQLQQRLIQRGAALVWLAREAGAFPLGNRPGIDFNQVLDQRIGGVLRRVESLFGTWNDVGPDRATGRAAWTDALAALEADANAPLPGT